MNGVEKAMNSVTALGTIIMHIVWGSGWRAENVKSIIVGTLYCPYQICCAD